MAIFKRIANAITAPEGASQQNVVQPSFPGSRASYTPTAYQQNLQTVQAPTMQSSRDILGQIYKNYTVGLESTENSHQSRAAMHRTSHQSDQLTRPVCHHTSKEADHRI